MRVTQSDRKKPTHLNPERVSALGMLRYAIEFFAAAEATDEAIGGDKAYWEVAPTPVVFLMGRAIELGLKAYLIHHGLPLSDLADRRKLSHDLIACLAEAEARGLIEHVVLSDQDRGVVQILNDSYKSKELEYFVSGARTLPIHGPLQDTAIRILDAVVATVPDAHLHLTSKAGQVFSALHRGRA